MVVFQQVVTYSYVAIFLYEQDSEIPKNMQKIFSTDQIRGDDQILKLKKLEEDCTAAFSAIIKYQGSQHISRYSNKSSLYSLLITQSCLYSALSYFRE